MSAPVRLSVCLSAFTSQEPSIQTLPNVLCMLPEAVACFLLALLRYVNHFRFGDDIILPTVAKAKATQVEHPASTHVDSPECSTDLTPRRIGNESVPKIMITQ